MIYKRLRIPVEPIVFPVTCKAAPEDISNEKIPLDSAYLKEMKSVVRIQLERAGLRLAKLLNELG